MQHTTTALVVGASGGIGRALAGALEARGARVLRLSRRDDRLDVTDEASVARALDRIEAPVDLVLVATGLLAAAGGTPEKALAALSADAFLQAMRVNALGPALVLKHAARLLPRDRRAVFAALSARVGSIGDNATGGWYSYRASKAALNQIVRTAAVELGRTHPKAVCVALHPGTVATAFTARYADRHPMVAPDLAAANLLAVIDSLAPDASGGFFDWQGAQVPW